MEEWKDILNYEGLYQASNMGNVRRIGAKNKRLKPCLDRDGYQTVTLCKDGIKKTKRVHRLVLEAFVGHSLMTVNHIDMDKSNNSLINLEYLESGENSRIAKHKTILQLDRNGNLIREWFGAMEAERLLHISNANISACCNKRRSSAGGFVWRFKHEQSHRHS